MKAKRDSPSQFVWKTPPGPGQESRVNCVNLNDTGVAGQSLEWDITPSLTRREGLKKGKERETEIRKKKKDEGAEGRGGR